ncbi:MAG: LrgB family protein [Bosea sp. (in: a-proteobacteria)]|nr:LrgB family protein [Bosea sp. (in: a-proteobacteria)]
MTLSGLWAMPVLHALFWSVLTIGFYALARVMHRRWPRNWLMPIAVAPVLVGLVLVALHGNYRDYIHSTGWLVAMLGPATVAVAVPIWEQRALIRRYWPILLAGMMMGTGTAVLTSWLLATLLGLDGALRLSLLPRSLSTPFAMAVSSDIGGIPDLTAVFVVLTGISGAMLGEVFLARIPLKSSLAKGALFGVAAHGAGTAKAHQVGQTEGAVAGLVMVLVGLLNVLAAPLLVHLL